ncbi:MAG: hypothetical protein ACRDJP_12985 [Actinomycetota bacterium]
MTNPMQEAGRPDPKLFWSWVLASLRPVAGWIAVGLGVLFLVFGWIGVSREVLVAKQLPYLVSGGFGGLGLIFLGSRLLLGEDLRTYEDRLVRMERLVDDLHELLVTVKGEGEPGETGTAFDAERGPISTNGMRVLVLDNGQSFHWPDCRLVEGKSGATGMTPADAGGAGLKPCRVCQPLARAGDPVRS